MSHIHKGKWGNGAKVNGAYPDSLIVKKSTDKKWEMLTCALKAQVNDSNIEKKNILKCVHCIQYLTF